MIARSRHGRLRMPVTLPAARETVIAAQLEAPALNACADNTRICRYE